MNFSYPQIVFQEVPNHISLAFSISGCPMGCAGCHSVETWNEQFGSELTDETFAAWLNKYQGMVSNVLFYGGEWEPKRLVELIRQAKARGLKTTLYTGLEFSQLPQQIIDHVSYLKTGKYIKKLGGITSTNSNQFFYDIDNRRNLTHLFRTTNLISSECVFYANV